MNTIERRLEGNFGERHVVFTLPRTVKQQKQKAKRDLQDKKARKHKASQITYTAVMRRPSLA